MFGSIILPLELGEGLGWCSHLCSVRDGLKSTLGDDGCMMGNSAPLFQILTDDDEYVKYLLYDQDGI